MTRGPTVLDGLAALVWLDWTAFAHRMRRMLREPKRLWTWIIFVGWLAMVAIGRMMGGQQSSNPVWFVSAAPVLGALIPGGFLVILGLIWTGAVRRAPAALSSPADGRFLLASDLSPHTVVFWLQMRQAWGLTRGVLLNALIWLAILLPSVGVTAHGIVLGMLAILFAALLLFGLRLPVFVLARRCPRLPVAAVGYAIAAVGAIAVLWQVASAVEGPAGSFVHRVLDHRLTLPLGSSVAAAISGRWGAIGLLFVLAAAAVALSVAVAGDCYPEIWEASNRAFAVRRLARRGRFGFGGEIRSALAEAGVGQRRRARAGVRSSGGRGVPGGGWVLLWKEWLAFRRAPGGLRAAALWVIGVAAAGAILGTFAMRQGPAGVEGMIVGVAIYPALFLSTASGISLAADLRRPIWWLSDESLAKRIGVWTLATSLRGIALITVGMVSAAIAAGTLAAMVFYVALGAAAIWLLRVIGLAVYTLLPSRTDLRGPGAVLRLLLTFMLLIPAGLAAGVTVALTGDANAAMAAGTAAAMAEGALLVLFAAARLRGNGIAVAQAEQH